jgi:hypothetical protein
MPHKLDFIAYLIWNCAADLAGSRKILTSFFAYALIVLKKWERVMPNGSCSDRTE